MFGEGGLLKQMIHEQGDALANQGDVGGLHGIGNETIGDTPFPLGQNALKTQEEIARHSLLDAATLHGCEEMLGSKFAFLATKGERKFFGILRKH